MRAAPQKHAARWAQPRAPGAGCAAAAAVGRGRGSRRTRPRHCSGAVQPSAELLQPQLRLCIGFKSIFRVPSSFSSFFFFFINFSALPSHSDLCSRWICRRLFLLIVRGPAVCLSEESQNTSRREKIMIIHVNMKQLCL